MSQLFNKYLLEITKSVSCNELEMIQSLWSGYGNISRYTLVGGEYKTVVIKCISLQQANEHPRGWGTDIGHNRKVKSYQVETNWYENWSQYCNDFCKMPKFLGAYKEGPMQWIVMEDLRDNFPLVKTNIDLAEVKACLKWLANFHATFLNKNPKGLWSVGSYWHLATRPEELEKIESVELKSKAHLIDQALNNCKYKTIVHGDAKLANFCFAKNKKMVAAVDFQYVGGGCGMKDVAYFLGSCLSGAATELYESELLTFYFTALQHAIISSQVKVDFEALEVEWRKMYPIACADFSRFLLGWMPTHQKVNAYQMKKVADVLASF